MSAADIMHATANYLSMKTDKISPDRYRTGNTAIHQHHYHNVDTEQLVKNKDGTTSSVRTIIINEDWLNGGKPTIIPTVWKGKILSNKDAAEMAYKAQMLGTQWPSFDSIEEANKADKFWHTEMAAPDGHVMSPQAFDAASPSYLDKVGERDSQGIKMSPLGVTNGR